MGWPKGRPRKPRIEGETTPSESTPRKPRKKRSALRTSEHAPGVKAAESVRQPRQPKPKRQATDNVRGVYEYRLPHACDLEDTAAEAAARLKEFYREVRAEGGADLEKRVKLGVKTRDPDKLAELIHRNALESDVIDWSQNAPRNRKTELENPLEGRVQAGSAGLWGDSEPDAESGEDDGQEGGGEAGEDVREVQPANSFTFLD